MMNLMRVVGIITRNPDEEGIEKVFEILRSPDVKLSFQKYIDIRCLDRAHIELFIMLLDAFSGTTSGAIRSYLPDKRYFDEESTFNRIVEEGGRATYAELIQFSAYAHFLRIHGVGADSVRFGEWMRVIRNLTINSIIERPAQFKSALRSVNDLLDHSYDMLDFLIKNECQPEVFSDQQIREERIKASLIRKSTRWKDAVVKAEQHGYFRGQIEFLLDFSGIIDAWKPTPLSDWSESEDDQYFAKFSAYLEKICLLFNSTGLITLGEFRTERALLSIGNYLFDHRQNRSFLENVSYPLSWKRLLRGEQIQKAGERRGFLKELLDKIDVKVGAAKSLDSIIASATIPDKWRSLIVKNSKFIEYCGKRQIRFCSGTKVYLLRGERRSGEHAELFSYQAYWELVERSSSGDLEPFRTPNYKFVRTDTDEPSIVFTYLAGKVKLQMDIWNVGSKFKLRVHATPDSIPECLRRDFREQPDFGFDENGDLSVNVEMDKLNETIDRVVEIVRKNVVS
jgi:hypothetical protein